MSPLEGALQMVALGFAVFPLAPGAVTPVFAKLDWKELATRDPSQVEAWAADGYNFGAHCAGFLALDVDMKGGKDGLGSLLELPALPVTRCHETPSGGWHYFFRAPDVRNSVGKLGTGLDVRGFGGYVVCPGSVVKGKAYRVADAEPVADAPAWLVERANESPKAADLATPDGVEIDSDASVARAITFLETCKPAIQGSGGDLRTYTVASTLVRDMALSAGTALALMLEHFNPRCEPPWDESDLAAKVRSAVKNAQNAIGTDTAEVWGADFSDLVADLAPRPMFRLLNWKPVDQIPPRPWLVENLLLRGAITGLVAPPGVGKSTFELAVAVALARGGDGFLGMAAKDGLPKRVLVVNVEDDEDEMLRRLHATLMHHKLSYKELRPFIHIYDRNNGVALKIAKRDKNRRPWTTREFAALEEYVSAHDIDLVCFDPLVDLHELEENSNAEMAYVMDALRQLSWRTQAATLVVHHTKKPSGASAGGYAGDLNSARGAVAFGGNVRVLRTMYGMTEAEAKELHVAENRRWRFVRVDDGKRSYGRKQDTVWLELTSVRLTEHEEAHTLAKADLKAAAEEYYETLAAAVCNAVVERGDKGMKIEEAAEFIRDTVFGESFTSDKAAAREIMAAFAKPRTVGAFEIRLEEIATGKEKVIRLLRARELVA